MGGLREKKKRESEEKILKVSKEIFLSKGYLEATMEEIAEKAEIGVGTLYNYFKSKSEIFIAIMSEELILDREESVQLEIDLERDASEIIINYMKKSLNNMKILGKKIWKELMAAAFGNPKSNNFLFKGMMKLDFKFIDKLELLLENMKSKGSLSKNFNSHEAAYAVYSVLLTQFVIYIYSEDINIDTMEKNIENQIRFIFEGKCSIQKNRE